MEVPSYVYIVVLILWILLRAFRQARTKPTPSSRAKLPPGPVPLPVIGNLLSLGDRPHRTLADLSRIHGPVMSLKLGWSTTVVISSATAAKKVLQEHDLSFSDRAVPEGVKCLDHHIRSVVWLPVTSPRWRDLRRIFKTHILSAERLAREQELRHRKVDQLLEHVRECAATGVSVDIGESVFSTMLNLMSNIILSMDLADPRTETAREFKSLVSGRMAALGAPNLSDFFPMLRCMDVQGIRRRLMGYTTRMCKLLDRFIDDRVLARKSRNYRPVNKDLLDALLDICEENKEELDRTVMRHLLMDLFTAGTDTTSITLEWTMAELIRNPAAFSRVREEIHRVIGRGNPVRESDTSSLPYLQAVVKETFRMHPSTPFLIPRRAREDTEIMGVTVPRDARVLVNVFAIGRDMESWEDPDSFRPERFLELEIDVKGLNFELIPFGAGRRICPGYPLALRMLPLMVASLVQGFHWKAEGGLAPDQVDMVDVVGFTLRKARPLRVIPIPLQ